MSDRSLDSKSIVLKPMAAAMPSLYIASIPLGCPARGVEHANIAANTVISLMKEELVNR